jgi:decaprenylphospho-beta-D-ribofuranose 2-oxidase
MECHVYRPERQRALKDILCEKHYDTYLARGLGRSYGDAAVNPGQAVLNMERLNRMLVFDAETGVLECESGVSLEEIINTFLPRGFFPVVTPGTKHVTVGGAIANDVHGKNHHRDGTFGLHVPEMEVLTSAGESLCCSPEENEELFWATVGGVGLTGIILSAKMQLQRVQSAYITVDYRRCSNLDAALETMRERDDNYPYSVAWVDCLATGKNLGRSVLMYGRHTPPEDLPAPLREAPFHCRRKPKATVPFDMPGFLLNPWSVKVFNSLFYARHGDREGLLSSYDAYFYPLDRISQWNRFYGKRGFAQYQATLPSGEVAGLVQLLERLSATRRASFLAVLKSMGEASPGLLSHPIKGYTLTLDIPNRPGLMSFLNELDHIVLDHGGRLYLAKDQAATPEVFAGMYPRLREFQAIQRRYDPEGCFSSSLARRLGIVDIKEGDHA